jgi:transposase
MSDTNWIAIRQDYEAGGMSLRQLAAKYGVSKTVIGERKFTEQWDNPKKRTADNGQRTADNVETGNVADSTPKKDLSTKDKQRLFLDAYAQHANVMVAARAVGIHRSTVYEWLEKDQDFSFAYNLAKEDAKDTLRAEIYRRAHDGWEEPVYQLGYLAGTVQKYSDTLLIFHSKALMPEYRDKQQVDLTTHASAKDMQSIHEAIAQALASYPEARVAVAEALVAVEKGRS